MWADARVYTTDKPIAPVFTQENILQTGSAAYHTEHISRMWIDRHDKKVTASFFDGSARIVPLVDLWALKWHNRYKP